MNACLGFLAVGLLSTGAFSESEGKISGIAINASASDAALANCEVVLRASHEGTFVVIETTTTDSNGRFAFSGLPAIEGVVYLPGANWQGIHYPGARVNLGPQRSTARIKLIAYDTVESPSPLVIRRHHINVQTSAEFLEISETVLIDNPTLHTFVGASAESEPVETLRLTLPRGLEKITFEREFHGRNFTLNHGVLSTDLPWRPGEQEIKYFYRLPADQAHQVIVRRMDLPAYDVSVTVNGDPHQVKCNLPSVRTDAHQIAFEHHDSEKPLPVGFELEIRLGSLPIPFGTYARWMASGLLALLLVVSGFVIRRRRERQTNDPSDPSQRHAASAPRKPSQRRAA